MAQLTKWWVAAFGWRKATTQEPRYFIGVNNKQIMEVVGVATFCIAIYYLLGATIRQGAYDVSAMAIVVVVVLMAAKSGVFLTGHVYCENNHRARLHRIIDQSFRCDLCNTTFKKDQLMYGCQACNWDACHCCATN